MLLLLNRFYELIEHASSRCDTRAVTGVLLRYGMDLAGEVIPIILLHIRELACPRAGDGGCIDVR